MDVLIYRTPRAGVSTNAYSVWQVVAASQSQPSHSRPSNLFLAPFCQPQFASQRLFNTIGCGTLAGSISESGRIATASHLESVGPQSVLRSRGPGPLPFYATLHLSSSFLVQEPGARLARQPPACTQRRTFCIELMLVGWRGRCAAGGTVELISWGSGPVAPRPLNR